MARFRYIPVILCGLLPRPQNEQVYQTGIKATNKALQHVCKAFGIPFTSIFKPFLYEGVLREEYFEQDGLHPSDKGRKAIFNALWQLDADSHTRPNIPVTQFKGPGNPLLNFYACELEVRGRQVAHTEQAYQIEKVDYNKSFMIRLALTKVADPYECYRVGKSWLFQTCCATNTAYSVCSGY